MLVLGLEISCAQYGHFQTACQGKFGELPNYYLEASYSVFWDMGAGEWAGFGENCLIERGGGGKMELR